MKTCKDIEFNLRRILYYFCFFLLQSTCAFSQQNDDLFEKGNQLFDQEQYVQACDVYKNIEDKGFVVLYNMALSYLNRGNVSQAIIHGRRAEKHASFKDLTKLDELFYCMNQRIDPDYELSWYGQFVMFFKKCMLTLPWLFIQICLLMLLLLLMVMWYKRLYRANIGVCFGTAFFCLLFFVVWLYKIDITQQQVGVVVKESTTVLSGPDELFYKKIELHDSDEFVIVDKQNRFYQIKTKQNVGWVHESSVELV